MTFIHLHVHSAYSLAEGAIRTKELVQLCAAQSMPAVAVTDTGNLFGALEFAMEAAKSGVQPIIGCQIRIGNEGHELVLLAQNESGYRHLCHLVSAAFLETDPQYAAHISYEQLADKAEGLICLSGGLRGPAAQYLLHNQDKDAKACLKKLQSIFGNRLYIELQRHGLPEEARIEPKLIDLAYALDIPLVATNDCYFATKDMHQAHDALLCISEGRYISETDRRTVTPEHYFKSAKEMIELFADLPEAVQNTEIIAKRCSYLLTPIDPILPPFETEAGRTEVEELRAQSFEGLHWRLENFVYTDEMDAAQKAELTKEYKDRLNYELGVIEQMGFPGYFLIVSDFIKWAKAQDIPVGPGRGSGAGSLVAWSLKITDLDPIRFGLLFERFLNPERVSMPDFDVDFCQERRDEVIRYVQDKYGRDRVAQIITFGKLQARAVVRDVGRVLQLPYGQVDRIAKMIPNNPANPTTLQEALDQDPDLRREMMREEATAKLIDIALKLEGLYRHASTHAAGVVIGDRPLQDLIPLYRDPRSDMPVTQFNMKFVEQAGLVKFDFLGLKTMTVIQKAVNLIGAAGTEIDILKLPFEDPKTYEIMTSGRTTGIFQLESAGMRDTLRRMKPDRLEDIIALVSLYRPGPMDNIPAYCRRKEGSEEPDYMHPILQPYLEETYGIMIYQEQVMQAAQALSGYTLGSADLLRRAMGKKIQSEMDAQREMFVSGAAEHHQVPNEKSSEIFDQIAKFAGYGFNKSHAAAYALIAFWTGWLKANYPLEFMAASMTLDKGNTDKLSVFKQELDRMDVTLLPPDINKSEVDFTVEGDAIRYALSALKGVGEQAMATLLAERSENGAFLSLEDFANRIPPGSMNKKQMEALICAGAFDSIDPNRARLLGGAEIMLRHAQEKAAEKESGQVSLFGGEEVEVSGFGMPPLPEAEDWELLEKLNHEFGAVGFYLSAHPLDEKEEILQNLKISTYAELLAAMENQSGGVFDLAGVLIKRQIKVSPKSGSKYAFLQLSDSSGVYELMIFSETLQASMSILEPGTQLFVKVGAEMRDEQLRLTAQSLASLDQMLNEKIRRLHLDVSSAKDIKAIKTILDQEGLGPVKIILTLDNINGKAAKITLPQNYRVSVQGRTALKKLSSVQELRES